MSKSQQKNKSKQKAKNLKPEKSVVKLSTPMKVAPVFSDNKKSVIRKLGNQKAKLPGVQNFWNIEAKSENKKRSAAVKLDDDDEADTNTKKARLTGADRYQRYIDEEERIRKVEDELAEGDIDPHTPDQFERALMKDRNSSFMWIKYMAFHLETAETEKARAVAKKAIASINFREEGELLNLWIALLNLEIRYGTDDTYNETLREAVQRNDPFKVYSRTLTVLLEIEKFEEAEKIIDSLKKKFKPHPEMWLQICEAYLKMKNERMAKQLFPKSLLSLQEKDRKFT